MRNKLIASLAGILILCAIFFKPIVAYSTVEMVENVTITSKERINTSTQSKYLVFTPDEVFENVDSYLFLKFDSSDVYGKIGVNSTCSLKVNGFRFKWFSWYRNIITADCKI